MANNQFITTSLVAKTALAEFAVACPWAVTGSRMYEADFTQSGYKIGDTLNIRRQNQFLVGDGSVATSQPIIQTVEQLQIAHQYHALIDYTMKDLTLSIDNFAQEFIRPAIQNIIAKLEKDIGVAAELALSQFVGTSGAAINSFAAVDAAGTKLLENGVDLGEDPYLALSLRDASALKAALLSGFTPMYNENIIKNSALGHLSYFDVFQSQNIKKHIAGAGPRLTPGDSLVVNGAVASGSTIVLAGATGGVTDYFVAGDVISIAGVEQVNPVSHESTGQNAQFVITANASSTGGGAVTISVQTLGSDIISDSASPLQNVSNAVPNNAVVTVVGSHNVNTAYVARGLDLAFPPLEVLQVQKHAREMDPETGISLTITEQGNINTYQNQMRLDVLCGFKWHPQYACRVVSTL